NGVAMPVLNVFRMFSKMDGERIAAESDGEIPLEEILGIGVRGRPDVAAMASFDERRLCVMVWHYHDDDIEGPAAKISLAVDGLPDDISEAKLTHYRIDEYHSNAY